jgi:multidrug efflux pump subunit AcrA (membrane-fusion protein)
MNGKNFVYMVRDEKIVEVQVSTGKTLGSYIEITDGLSNGDKIIENASSDLKEGMKVKTK